MVSSNFSNLIPPRYVPFVLKDTVLAVWFDNREGKYAAVCPNCHEVISYCTLDALYREMVWSEQRCCQGCRARITLEKDPGLIGLFLDFWYRTGKFPESSSWIEAIPPHLLNVWQREIRASLPFPTPGTCEKIP